MFFRSLLSSITLMSSKTQLIPLVICSLVLVIDAYNTIRTLGQDRLIDLYYRLE